MKGALLLAGVLLTPVLVTAQEPAPEPRPTGIFSVRTVPRLANTVEPECTAEAIQAQVRDVVVVNVQINHAGEPVSLEVAQSPGYGLGPKALEAISQWRWQDSPEQAADLEQRFDATVQMSFECKVLPPMKAN